MSSQEERQQAPASTTSFCSLLPCYEEDRKLVGTKEILVSSPNVTEAPDHVNRPVPVPSIYSDERGQIHNLLIGAGTGNSGKRINLLYTKAGVKRSGDLHAESQHDFIFSGKVQLSTLTADGSTTSRIYTAYDYIAIPPDTPHLFEFVEDTVMAEWWDGPFHAWFYTPYRNLVQQSFSTTATKTKVPGKFYRYAILPSDDDERKVAKEKYDRTCQRIGWMSLVIAGCSVGFIVGRRSR